MTEAIARHSGAKCAICHDLIRKGDLIELHEDHWAHSDCIPSPAPWDTTPTQKLHSILKDRNLLQATLDADLDPDSLPPRFQELYWNLTILENKIVGLLDCVASEHEAVS